MSVSYTATLPVGDHTVTELTGLLEAERTRRGTRAGTRSLTSHDQAVLILRWFLDGTRMHQLATDNAIGKSTAYDYLHEGINVLAAGGYSHVGIDGTLIETDRCAVPGPTPQWICGGRENIISMGETCRS